MPLEYKRALTREEAIKCAYLYFLRGVPQHDLAIAFEVNQGRINEALMAVKIAADNPRALLKDMGHYENERSDRRRLDPAHDEPDRAGAIGYSGPVAE